MFGHMLLLPLPRLLPLLHLDQLCCFVAVCLHTLYVGVSLSQMWRCSACCVHAVCAAAAMALCTQFNACQGAHTRELGCQTHLCLIACSLAESPVQCLPHLLQGQQTSFLKPWSIERS